MHYIAIDAGHGYVKGLAAGAQVLFPALIAAAPPTVDLGAYAQDTVTWIDGTPFRVGDAARRWAVPLWTKEKATDADTLRLLLVAAARLGASGPVALATGLPLAWWGSQHRALHDALQGYGGTVQKPGANPVRVWFDHVLVLPQGIAAAGPVLDDPFYGPGPYLVVDIGYRTTDYCLVTKDAQGALTFDPASAGSLDMGMHAVHAALADTLTHTYHTTFTAAQVADVPTVIVRGAQIDLTALRTEHSQRVAQAIVHALLEKLDQQMDQVLGLVAVGGGSALLTQNLPDVIQSVDPQWANARGYLTALLATQPSSGAFIGPR